ncbi:MAG: ABC transporter substrate-binding protein [Betaproteobacteria bacterium]
MKRGRRKFAAGALLLLSVPGIVAAQPANRTLRVAMLSESTEAARRVPETLFRERLAQLGYVEGRNLAIERRYANGVTARLPALAAELTAWKPDVIVAVSTPGALAAKYATSTIPVVFIGPADPVGSGIVTNLGRPDRNVTGFSPMQAEIGAKWIELLREIVPQAKRGAYLTDTGNGGEMLVFEQLRARATALGATVEAFDGIQPGALERSFAAIARGRFDGLVVALTSALLAHRDAIIRFAEQSRLPAIYARREYPEAGGLLSYGADISALFQRAADYVHRIAQGTKPGDLPVERPTVVRMVVNQRAARALGIKLPPSILVVADEVID